MMKAAAPTLRAIGIALAALLACSQTLLAQTLLAQTAPSSTRPLRIGTDGSYPPFGSTTPAGKLVGFEIDLVNDLCRRMQTPCQFVVVDWNGMIPKLQEGTVDIIMSGLSIKPERRKAIDFSLPYFSAPTYFVARKDAPAVYQSAVPFIDLGKATPEQLKALDALGAHLQKAVIGVEGATTHEQYVKKYFPQSGQVRIYPKQESLFLDLSIGRVDAVCSGYSTVMRFIRDERAKGREYVMFGPGVRGGVLGEGVAFGLRKDNDALESKLNGALRAAANEGVVSTLSKQWFGIDGSIKYEQTIATR
jgi:octopine/nopaline transport system substrate-binding protein